MSIDLIISQQEKCSALNQIINNVERAIQYKQKSFAIKSSLIALTLSQYLETSEDDPDLPQELSCYLAEDMSLFLSQIAILTKVGTQNMCIT